MLVYSGGLSVAEYGACQSFSQRPVISMSIFGSSSRALPPTGFASSLWRWWWRCAAFVIASLATPHYKAETRLLIETRESVFTRPQGDSESDKPLLDEEGVTSQVEVISSTDILKQVARKLDLAKLPEFDEAAGMSAFGRLLVIAGLKADPNEIPAEERVLKSFREKLTVYRVEKSRVIVIEFSSEDPRSRRRHPQRHRRRLSHRGARRQAAVERRRDRLAGAGNRRR